MKITVTVDLPNRPKGDPIEVPLLGGVVENGSKVNVELSDESIELLEAAYGIKVSKTKGGGESEG